MKHYVVLISWASDYEQGVGIVGVAHTLEEAKEIFNKNLEWEKNLAEENGWEVYENTETCFDAGKEGYYSQDHTRIYIQGVKQ